MRGAEQGSKAERQEHRATDGEKGRGRGRGRGEDHGEETGGGGGEPQREERQGAWGTGHPRRQRGSKEQERKGALRPGPGEALKASGPMALPTGPRKPRSSY